MGYEESCKLFEELCRQVGTQKANEIFDDDPFAGCVFDGGYSLYTKEEIAEFNSPCYGCDEHCSECEIHNVNGEW
jgi:hypothetical protein